MIRLVLGSNGCSFRKPHLKLLWRGTESDHDPHAWRTLSGFCGEFVLDCLRSPEQLKAQNAVLRHQLNILRRKAPKRSKLSGRDRQLLGWLLRLFPRVSRVPSPSSVLRRSLAGIELAFELGGAGSPVVGALGLRLIVNCGPHSSHV